MTLPFQNYLFYLIAKNENDLDVWKNLRLWNYSIREEEIKTCREELMSIKKFDLGKFLREKGIDFSIDEFLNDQKTVTIFKDRTSRLVLECLLMKSILTKDILQALKTKYANIEWGEDFINKFKKLLWDVDVMDQSTWGSYLEKCDEAPRKYYVMALNSTKEKLFLDFGLEYLLDLSQEEIFDRVLKTLYIKFQSHKFNDRELINLARVLTEMFSIIKMEKIHDDAAGDLQKILTQAIQMSET